MNVIVVGCGAFAQQITIPILDSNTSIDKIYLVDKNIDFAKEASNNFTVSGISDNYEDHISNSDFAMICVPNHLHSRISIDMLQKGQHVLCEKPMAINLEDCISMIQASKESKRILKIGHYLRYSSGAQFAKQILDSGQLGKILYFNGSYGWNWSWSSKTDFYLDKSLVGGGVLMDSGCHIIDLVLWLLGNCEKYNYNEITGFHGSDDLEDEVHVELFLSNGSSGKITNSRIRTLENKLEIRGEKGFIELDLANLNQGKINIQESAFSSDGKALIFESDINPFQVQLSNFIEDIQKGNQGDNGLSFMKSIELILDIYASNK